MRKCSFSQLVRHYVLQQNHKKKYFPLSLVLFLEVTQIKPSHLIDPHWNHSFYSIITTNIIAIYIRMILIRHTAGNSKSMDLIRVDAINTIRIRFQVES